MKLLSPLVLTRLRMLPAALALLGFMWASIDLHQHEDGIHNLVHCTVCALEKASIQGLDLFLTPQIKVDKAEFILKPWQGEKLDAKYIHTAHIRAPPLLTFYS